ncbi:MAG: ATP-dependent DNA helicase [Gammaproteobacteria bacterium]|nr:ATP-dependent DNA helicase [Gammaproteobacteria bacterium]
MEQDASDMGKIQDYADKVESALHSFRSSIGDNEQRAPWLQILGKLGVKTKLSDLVNCLTDLLEQLDIAAERGKGLQQCHSRCEELIGLLEYFDQSKADDNMILWLDIRSTGIVLHATPHEVSHYFQQWMDEKPTAWIFTSATLTVAGKFNNFSQQLGINDAETKVWLSPFDFEKQSLLYMPHIPVEPKDDSYNEHIIKLAKQIISYSKGRTFLLFTSYRSMNCVAEALVDIDYPIMVQGTASKAKLLDDFRQHGHAVLLGTNSFWEGVDVRGDALSCVMIDKIPFASPGDPVLQARIDALRERGGNPFSSIQIPAAVIQLKQGMGRLIRDPNDYGVLVLCRSTIFNKTLRQTFFT